jgi:predicted membrane protein
MAKSATAAAAIVVAAVWTLSCNLSGPPGPVVHEHHEVERGAATGARVEIDMSAGELTVKSGAMMLFEGDFDFNIAALKPAVAYAVNGGTGTLKVSQGSASGNYENSWRLNLDEATPLDLHINLGAGDSQLMLGRLNLQGLTVRLGAGDVTVDLRGMPSRSYPARIQTGAGDTTIHLPAGVGISASTSGLIGDVSVDGLEQRDGRWVNARAVKSPVTVDVQVQHAIGDLKLLAE